MIIAYKTVLYTFIHKNNKNEEILNMQNFNKNKDILFYGGFSIFTFNYFFISNNNGGFGISTFNYIFISNNNLNFNIKW